VKPDPLLHTKPDARRQVKSNPLLPTWFPEMQIHCYYQSYIHPYQLAPSEARSNASCLLAQSPDLLLPAKPDPLLLAGFHWVQIDCYQRSQIHTYQLAPSENRFKASCQLIANPDSLLPAKPHPPLPACFERVQFHCYHGSQIQSFLPAHSESRFSATSEATSTPTSLLQASSVSLLTVKPDPPLSACSQRSHI